MYSSVGTCLIFKCHHLAVSIMKSNSVIVRTYTWKKYSFVWNGLRCGIGYTSQSTESALRCSWMVQCLICLSLSSSFFILVNIDDLGIGRSVHNLGRGEMRVFRTPWSACSRHAGIRQQTPVSYLVLCTGQYSNGVKLSDVLPCSLRMLNPYVSYDVVDHSLTAICQARLYPQVWCQPKYGVRADVSFHREARAWSADSLLVAWGLYHSPPTFFRKHNFTQARHLSSGVWLVCSLLSHKFGEGDGIVTNLVCVVSAGINGICFE